MNEELQSTNEELETINDELRERTGELNQVNEFLETILTSLGFGVAVLDRTSACGLEPAHEDLWGLRADEAVDNHFLSLDIGLPSSSSPRRCARAGRHERARDPRPGGDQPARAEIICAATVLPLVGPAPGDGTRVRGRSC